MDFRLTSDAFQNDDTIPERYVCVGEDFSPPLRWTQPPDGTRSFALIVEDQDAAGGTYVHWIAYNIHANTRLLEEAMPVAPELPNGIRQGRNNDDTVGYTGPCPPGTARRYFFRLYALDSRLDLPPGATKQQLLDAMQGHILAKAELVGWHSRR